MGRSPCCSKEGLNRGAWTALEDKILKSYIKTHGEGNWRSLPKKAGLKRCGKSCRLRWLNYLRPDIKRGNISGDEEELIIRLHNLLGNRWSLIAGRLPGRTDNEIKNYWNTTLGKKAKLAKQNSFSSSPPMSNIQITTNNNIISTSSEVKVIRTKATKCSTKLMVVPSSQLPNTTDHSDDQNPPALDEPRQNYPVNGEALTIASPPTCGELRGFDDGEYDAAAVGYHDGQKWESYSGNLSFEDLGLTLPFDVHEAMFDDWVPSNTTSTCLDHEEENATLDLDSLAFLLDPEEWPGIH